MAIPLGLYAHFPWCVKKCPYCDFNSHPLRGDLQPDNYLNALLRDWRYQLPDFQMRPLISIFFGGGTPSLFPPETFARLLDAVLDSPGTAAGKPGQSSVDAQIEITMEANPGTTEHADFGAYRRAGINRLSLGAQSFDNRQLQRLGRVHSAANTYHAFAQARAGGFDNINVDIMYALPEQGVTDALSDLDAAIALNPEHISWYQLTLEPKTEFARRPPLLPTEKTVEAMEREGRAKLISAGYHRYEVSAWARRTSSIPHQAAHNLNYWQFGDYIGIGAGAHGKITASDNSTVKRSAKPNPPRLYLAAPEEAKEAAVTAADLPGEFLMNALRLTDGVSRELFTERTGLPFSTLQETWGELAELELVHPHRLQTTERGFELLDLVVSRLI